MNNKPYYVFMCPMLLSLTSCSNGWKESFDEKPVPGYPHSSVSQISDLIKNGAINFESENANHNTDHKDIKLFPCGNAYRTTEFTQKLYIMPYEDSEHNFHEGHYVHTVINPSHWDVNSKVKETRE